MKVLVQVAAIVAAVLTTGCSTDFIHRMMRHDAAELTDFLPGKERLVRRPDTYPVHYSWMDTNAVVRADYKNVYIAPFDVSYLRKGNGYDTLRDKAVGLDDAITELGDFGRNAFIQAFKQREGDTKLKVVDDPETPHTAIMEFAITAFVPTRAEIEVVGTVGSFFCPVPGVGIVADCLAAGEIAIECRVRDSGTKEVVLMFADAEGEPKALLQFAKYTYTASAKINLKQLAKALAESCAVEDESKMRRDFPFKFIALPWDANLDK